MDLSLALNTVNKNAVENCHQFWVYVEGKKERRVVVTSNGEEAERRQKPKANWCARAHAWLLRHAASVYQVRSTSEFPNILHSHRVFPKIK